jgi:molybdenum cofactor synthesis domain-containing protein
MPDLDLFDKTEIWLTGVTTRGARLPDVAAAAASVLSIGANEVFVTDVRGDHIVLDLLTPRVRLEDVIGRSDDLLAGVGAVAGVAVAADAAVHSRGVLGILGAPSDQVDDILVTASALEANLRAYVARRIAVVSTGTEMQDGRVHDTNVEAIEDLAGAAGYEVSFGGVVGDDERAIAGRVARLVEDGYGIVITTGGVGAEDKDRTVEGLQLLAPDLATAVLASYVVGHGRHVKPDVRVAAGRFDDAVIVALPGPTREVRAAVPALLDALAAGVGSERIAEAVAEPIRALWRAHQEAWVDQHDDDEHRRPSEHGGQP